MSKLDDLFAILRTPDTGYGSAALELACLAEEERSWIEGAGPRAAWLRIWRGLLPLLCYRARIPPVSIVLTDSASGRTIGEHLAIRERGRPRYRRAQGVLPLPAHFSEYLRGRHRQAVRTNLSHARRAGLTAHVSAVPQWTPGIVDSRAPHLSPAPVELWTVRNAGGEVVANSIVSVDENVALLHGLVAHERHARWLLHAAIVERLCGHCDLLLINSEAAYRMNRGARHFQQLLGYRIATLRVTQPPSPEPAPRRRRSGGWVSSAAMWVRSSG